MKRKAQLFGIILVFLFSLMPTLSHALDTVVVGRPYYYGGVPYGYGPYAPLAYPGLYNGQGFEGGSMQNAASNPFFLNYFQGQAGAVQGPVGNPVGPGNAFIRGGVRGPGYNPY